MKKRISIKWVPKVIAVIYIIFLAVVSLDSFSSGKVFSKQLTEFLVQLVPAVIVLISLLISLKREKLGGWLFLAIAIVFTIFFQTYRSWDLLLMISLPPMIVGFLFLKD